MRQMDDILSPYVRKFLAFSSMTDLKDLSKVIENIAPEQKILSSVLQSPEDTEFERKLRELKFRQELRKDWILFILKDVVVFSAALVFIFAFGGYSLFTLIRESSFNDEKKFAISVSLIVTGLLSFIAGKAWQPPSSK